MTRPCLSLAGPNPHTSGARGRALETDLERMGCMRCMDCMRMALLGV